MSIILTYDYNYFILNYIFNIYTNIPYYFVICNEYKYISRYVNFQNVLFCYDFALNYLNLFLVINNILINY